MLHYIQNSGVAGSSRDIFTISTTSTINLQERAIHHNEYIFTDTMFLLEFTFENKNFTIRVYIVVFVQK